MRLDTDAASVGKGISTTPVRLTEFMNYTFVASVRRFIFTLNYAMIKILIDTNVQEKEHGRGVE